MNDITMPIGYLIIGFYLRGRYIQKNHWPIWPAALLVVLYDILLG